MVFSGGRGTLRLGTAEPLGLCKAPTEPLGKNSSYSHNLLQRYVFFLNYVQFVHVFLAERKIGAFIDKNHGPRGPKNQELPPTPS